MMAGSNNKAFVLAAFGATGSGKSHAIKKLLKRLKPNKLIIWDTKLEYGNFGQVVTTFSDLINACKTSTGKKKANYKIIMQPVEKHRDNPEAFNMVCKLAFKMTGCTYVADELQRVTTASSAPHWWKICVADGRHEGMTLIGAGQRPANVNKDILSNATFIRGFRLNHSGDIQTMKDFFDITKAEYKSLSEFQYWESDCINGKSSIKKEKK